MGDSSQEKTEQPTSKRLEEARAKGQIAYSKELSGSVLFLVGLYTLQVSGDEIMDSLTALCHTMFALPVSALTESDPSEFLGMLLSTVIERLAPIFAIATLATVAPGFLQTKFQMSPKKLQLDASKLNPLSGIKRLFSLQSAMQVAMSLLKVGLVGLVVWVTVFDAIPLLVSLADNPIRRVISVMMQLAFLLGFRVGAGLVLIAIIDLMFQKWKTRKDLMMTKEDVKEERKKSEGDPRIRNRIREAQRQIALQRMKTDIKTADVVVRNPTHFAVAIKYEKDDGGAPRVVGKGRSEMALTLIRLAAENGVEVVVNKPLARELYRSVNVGDFIPERLFKAVAEILAFVYRKNGVAAGGA